MQSVGVRHLYFQFAQIQAEAATGRLPRPLERLRRTVDTYFENHVHDYPPSRLDPLIPHIQRLRPGYSSLLDIGCGTGNTMQTMAERLGIESPVGVESSRSLVKLAAERTGYRVIYGSVLEDNFPDVVSGRYDIVVLSSVLHHLVGRTRRTSFRMVRTALQNARRVLAPGGLLVVHEPVMTPSISMSLLFYTKLVIGGITHGRVGIGSYWANIGAPLVSYLTPKQLEKMVGEAEYYSLEKTPLPKVPTMTGMSRYDAAYIVQNHSQNGSGPTLSPSTGESKERG